MFGKSKKLTGGHVTESGHKIGMTDDQMTDFMMKYSAAVRDINTSSAFTPEQKKDLIKNMPNMSDFGFYKFLNSQYQGDMQLASYIKNLIGKDRANK